jgi:hypothetical protein
MVKLLGLVVLVAVLGIVVAGLLWLLWWLAVITLGVAVAGLVWRWVTQR